MDEGMRSRDAAPPAVPQTQTEAASSANGRSSPDEVSDFEADLGEDLDLLKALDNIESTGSFASFAALRTLNLDLVVKDVGAIALPLQESQAREIIEKARQAPCGKGEKTIVDTSIRNTWELDTSQFDLQGAEWEKLLEHIVARVGRDLGASSPIRAEPYKMLVYETGAMFKAHTDSPKIQGMFGTLVICLPSAHQGGEVIVKHRHEKKILRSSKVAQGFMSWYSDVQHEVLPVTSGYRWVLTYNLALDPSAERPSARLVRAGVSHLRRALRQWLSEAAGSQQVQPLIYPLDHHYTEASISLKAFKGRDVAVVQALRDISSELPMNVFLGILEKTAMGSCGGGEYGGCYGRRSYYDSPDDEDHDQDDDKDWHSLDDDIETTFAIKKLVDLNGVHLAEDIDITEDNLLRDCFLGADGEEISYEEGYAGNEGGPSATHAYRASGVLLLPLASTPPFLQGTVDNSKPYSSCGTKEDNLQSLLAYFSNKCKEPSRDGSSLLMLKSLCECSWDPNHKALYSWQTKPVPGKAAVTGLLQASARMKDWEFFERAVENARGNFGLEFFGWFKEEITNGLSFAEVQNPLLHAVLSLRTLSDMLAAVMAIAPPLPDRQLQVGTGEVQEWEQTTLERVLDAAESKALGYIDGQPLVHHCLHYRDVAYIQTRIMPFMEKQTEQVAFSLAFLSSIAHEARKSESEPPQRHQWLGIYEPLAKALISAMSIPAITSLRTPDSVTRVSQNPGTSSAPAQYHALSGILGDCLSMFYQDLFALETANSLSQDLTAKIAAAAHLIKPEQFPHIWIPLLQQLIPILDKNSIPLSTPEYQHLYTTLLTAYLEKCVGKQPAKPTSLRRPTVSCSCADCARLNIFLADPNQRTFRIAVNKQRRGHLHSNLEHGRIDCTHVTERVGSPQTLVVTKTTKTADLARRQWAARRTGAEKVLVAFPRGKLRVLLGAEYDRIVKMDGIGEVGWGAPARGVVGAVNGGLSSDGLLPSRARAGVKRKAEEPLEVIDLTGED